MTSKPETTATPPPAGFEVATAAQADLLSALHGQCFDRGWTAEDFAVLLNTPGYRAGLLTTSLDAAGSAAPDQPVGFIMTRQVAGEAEIITLGIRPAHRKKGWGGRLLASALARLDPAAVDNIFLEVAVTNGPAILLYRRFGFETVRTRKAYYQTFPKPTDALVMKLAFGPGRVNMET